MCTTTIVEEMLLYTFDSKAHAYNEYQSLKTHDFKLDVAKRLVGKLVIKLQMRYDYIVIPETTNPELLRYLAVSLTPIKGICFLQKATPLDILTKIDSSVLMKQEYASLAKALRSVTTVKMRGLTANQRRLVIPHLFKSIQLVEDNYPDNDMSNVLLLDDSSFSGSTFKAMCSSINGKNCQCHSMALFGFTTNNKGKNNV